MKKANKQNKNKQKQKTNEKRQCQNDLRYSLSQKL